mmetsp:Transcript_16870/g.37841  ORF Transcript_16870/g.37841 Transcript_16870/m.37841 type:complete len:221 (+) Transcript_16870:96-758(+)
MCGNIHGLALPLRCKLIPRRSCNENNYSNNPHATHIAVTRAKGCMIVDTRSHCMIVYTRVLPTPHASTSACKFKLTVFMVVSNFSCIWSTLLFTMSIRFVTASLSSMWRSLSSVIRSRDADATACSVSFSFLAWALRSCSTRNLPSLTLALFIPCEITSPPVMDALLLSPTPSAPSSAPASVESPIASMAFRCLSATCTERRLLRSRLRAAVLLHIDGFL